MSKRDLMRERLAHHAARLMAEDGITDYAFAKRKAARQLGASDTQHLPSNQEVEEALRSFRALYQRDSHPKVLRQLREDAQALMQRLAPLHPYLTGSVLSGTAGAQSDINLCVYSDDDKAVMLYLLRYNIPFDGGEWRTQIAGRMQMVPSFTVETEHGVPAHIVVLPASAAFSGSRKTDTHADLAALESLLATA